MRYCRNFAKAGLKLSQYIVATQESINSRFCSVVEIKLSFFLKGGHLPRSGSTVHCSTSLNQNQMTIKTVLVFSECFLNGFYLISPSTLELTLYNQHQAEPHVNDQI